MFIFDIFSSFVIIRKKRRKIPLVYSKKAAIAYPVIDIFKKYKKMTKGFVILKRSKYFQCILKLCFKNSFDKDFEIIIKSVRNIVPKIPLSNTIVYIEKLDKSVINKPTFPMKIPDKNILILEIVGLK
jgi:hypothetical protein